MKKRNQVCSAVLALAMAVNLGTIPAFAANADATSCKEGTYPDTATAVLTAEKGTQEEYTYLYAALTWEEYWAAEGVYAAGSTDSSEDLDAKGETDKGAFDAVSRATTNHGLHRGSFQSVAVIYDTDGTAYTVSSWTDSDNAVLTDGRTLTKASDRSTGVTTLSLSDGTTATMDHYEVTGIKYVPVKVATADLKAFCDQYTVVSNGETLSGGYSEQNLTAYTATAAVDENTNGLKTATKNSDGTFSFSARTTGTGSGLKDAAQKTVDADKLTVTVKEANGSYGEFLRVDLTGDAYGDLGANLYAVVWTYYGEDSTYTTALQTYGTKFAADNWMHKAMGIQLGLTDSLRCQLPEGTDGTGYWTITVCAMGYEDHTVQFQATADNIVKAEEDEQVDTSKLEALVAKAKALKESDYTSATWKAMTLELDESVELLAKSDLTQTMVDEQVTHLSAALDALEKVETDECGGGSSCPSDSYTDLDSSKWYHTSVDYVIKNGLMVGDSGKFSPNGTLTRAMLAQILYNQAGTPAVTAENPFTDVDSGKWYSDAIRWAYAQNLVEGYGDGRFGPEDYVTREQLATILWRAAGSPEPTQTTLHFTDAGKIDSYAKKAMLWVNENHIVEGYDNGTAQPLAYATRAEAATMLMSYLER
jgi:hypothetical protein